MPFGRKKAPYGLHGNGFRNMEAWIAKGSDAWLPFRITLPRMDGGGKGAPLGWRGVTGIRE